MIELLRITFLCRVIVYDAVHGDHLIVCIFNSNFFDGLQKYK